MNKSPSFQERLLREVAKVPRGKVTTYKELAVKLNSSPRAVGQSLKRNPFLVDIPCHRVIKSNGEVGGYVGTQYEEKIRLLREEGIQISNGKVILG